MTTLQFASVCWLSGSAFLWASTVRGAESVFATRCGIVCFVIGSLVSLFA